MDNYKIPNTEEAISLLDELGYDVTGLNDISSFLYAKAQDKNVFNGVVHPEDYESISVAKLYDLVVLNRKNPADGNYRLFISDSQGELNLYKTSDDVFYVFSKELKGWDKSRAVNINTEGLVKKGEEKDPALISGAEALRALADGKEVELLDEELDIPWTKIMTEKDERNAIEPCISMFFDGYREIKFRLKPQTIKLELEMPKPFEPKDGDEYFYISTLQNCLYSHDVWSDEPADITQAAFGAYRTEDDVKKAVEQLRKIRGTNS